MTRPSDKAYVWDLPLRLFHWLLVACIIGAFVTAKIGGNLMVWHGRLGLAILGLLVFRIVWGFVGSTYARFPQFVRGPQTILAYLRGQWQGQGHNPLGALSVLGLLGIVLAQAITGLFANDDIAFNGYLVPLVGSELSGQITSIHRLMENALIALIALHIGAIVFYAHIKKQNLVKPMLSGWAEGTLAQSTKGSRPTAVVLAILIAVAVVWAASGGILPPQPATPTSVAPAF
ncbi:MAG: cytochrome b/b6 domain-containing protein [Rhodocyclaceae bacterium]|nr:cytochrome b/b6 domain-containing protein [Rhodocyclaceae bacterium]MDZ4215337.1 cytochrome b/b6 domain-containing protein [Rhodocyclaceae bacterium]